MGITPRIGVLAVQGDFREHAAVLRGLGAEVVEVRRPEELSGLDGLVIPGGESTTFVRLMRLYGLDEAVRSFPGAVFGTCAGMIVLDRHHLGLIDVEVERNAYGRQPASFEADLEVAGESEPVRGVFPGSHSPGRQASDAQGSAYSYDQAALGQDPAASGCRVRRRPASPVASRIRPGRRDVGA